MFNNFDFEWFGRVIFSFIEIAVIFGIIAAILNTVEKPIKKLLRAILRNADARAERLARRERELREIQYISVLYDPDYYGD